MKRFELTFTFLQLPFDFLAIVLAGFAAYGLRFTEFVTSIRPVIFDLPWNHYWPVVLIVAVGWIILFAFAGLYHSDPNKKLAPDLRRAIFACSTGFAAITIYVFFTLQKFDSRFLVLAGWILAIIFVCAERIILRLIKIWLNRLGFGLRRVVIIGGEKIATAVRSILEKNKYLGYKIIGQFPNFSETIANEISQLSPDEIIFTDPKSDEESALSAIDFAEDRHIVFKYSADLFDTISTNIAVSTIGDVPIIELKRTRLYGWGSILKRLFDIFFALIFIIILSPFYLLISIIILIETGRPIIYKNERVGNRGQKFFTYKFRSMFQKFCTGPQFDKNSEAATTENELIKTQNTKDGPVYKIKDDPRVTKFGKFIRRWSMDELPQFFNVLFGSMSLVGPRPHQPREVAKYQKHHKKVLAIKPGITGLAQISGRSDLDFETEVKLDTFYIEHWSLVMDLVILVKTPFVVILRKGAW